MTPSPITPQTAAILVDLQADFTELYHGPLATKDSGQQYINTVESSLKQLTQNGIPVIATQDWHPPGHISFASSHPDKEPFETTELSHGSQVLWPEHCVQESQGARILVKDSALIHDTVRKGTNPSFDSYSGFFDDGGQATGLTELLQQKDISDLLIFGLATDYCVKATALDALKEGFKVTFIQNLSRGVATGTSDESIGTMKKSGIRIAQSLSEVSEIFT